MKLCSIIWTSWTTLPAAARAPDSSESPAAMKGDSRSFCGNRNEVMNQQRPGKETDTSGCLSKVSCARVRVKFLYSEPRASLSCIEGHLLFTMLSFFVLSGPPSHIPCSWPQLCTAAQFNLPNAVTGQANQPPESHQGPAKHFQLWTMWTHLVKCHDNIKRFHIPVTQPALVNGAVTSLGI